MIELNKIYNEDCFQTIQKMKIEEKINMIGRILADIQFEIKTIKASQKELRDFLTNPDKLDVERFWGKTSNSEPKGSKR